MQNYYDVEFVRGGKDTGEIYEGADYIMHGRLWGIPAALMQEDISGPCKPGGLVDRILKAANNEKQ